MLSSDLQILVVEDSSTDAELLIRSLRGALSIPFEFDHVLRLDEAIPRLDNDRIGLIVTDLNLPDSSGLETFERIRDVAGDIPIVVLSGNEDIELAIEAVRRGAQDYVVKGTITSESLGHCIRFAIERGRRIQAERERDDAKRELRIAHDIQKSMYPSEGIRLTGYDIAGAAWSAEQVCGDYYDFFPIPGGRYGVAVGDVCGHGLPAALMALQMRACLRLLARQGAAPGKVIAGVHHEILHEDPAQRRFASLFYGVLDPDSGTFNYSSAGHPGLLLKADGSPEPLEPTAAIIGILDNIGQEPDQAIRLQPGDTLALLTDGFQEAADKDRQQFGRQRLIDAIQGCAPSSSAETIQCVYEAVVAFSGEALIQDDMTAVVVSVA